MSNLELSGRKCRFIQISKSGSVVFIGGNFDHTAALPEMIASMTEHIPAAYLMFDLPDWMNDCSPWNAVIGDEMIAGNAGRTLEWLLREAIPFVRRSYPESEIMIAGYSMAGLLALWCMYQTDVFSAAACCSGSLWYPGWNEFMDRNRICGKDVSVYLSLGGKEANTAVSHMKDIEKNTRLQSGLLRKDPGVRNTVLEMNSGGHFTKVAERQAEGIAWLLNDRHIIEK